MCFFYMRFDIAILHLCNASNIVLIDDYGGFIHLYTTSLLNIHSRVVSDSPIISEWLVDIATMDCLIDLQEIASFPQIKTFE